MIRFEDVILLCHSFVHADPGLPKWRLNGRWSLAGSSRTRLLDFAVTTGFLGVYT